MINSFNQFCYFEEVQNEVVDYLSLREETNYFDVFGVCEMIENYFGLEVSESLIKKIIFDDLDLASEVKQNSFEDTCVRENFIDAVLKEVGLPPWPMNKDSEAYKIEFRQRLRKVCEDEQSSLRFSEQEPFL